MRRRPPYLAGHQGGLQHVYHGVQEVRVASPDCALLACAGGDRHGRGKGAPAEHVDVGAIARNGEHPRAL